MATAGTRWGEVAGFVLPVMLVEEEVPGLKVMLEELVEEEVLDRERAKDQEETRGQLGLKEQDRGPLT